MADKIDKESKKKKQKGFKNFNEGRYDMGFNCSVYITEEQKERLSNDNDCI